jgi:signal transduction histidine kinase/ABC-type uncharacterized transport system substrate-binding protein
MLSACAAAAADRGKRVVLLSESESNLPAVVALETALRETLRAKYPLSLDIYSEYFDVDRFPGPELATNTATYLERKYANTAVDVVIALGPQALAFALQHRGTLFSGVPLLYVTIEAFDTAGQNLPPDVFGVTFHTDLVPTIELALRLQPDAKQLVVVSGDEFQDRMWETRAHSELSIYKDRLHLSFLSALPMADLLHRLAQLPRDSIVLYLTIAEDGAGQLFRPADAAKMVSDASSAPVYGVSDTFLRMGIVGGHMDTFAAKGHEIGEVASRILGGEPVAKETVTAGDNPTYYVNALQLQRWHLDEAKLPPGTIVQFKTPSLWEQFRWQIIGLFAVVAIQSLIMSAALIQNRWRRKAEVRARESEERMTLAAEAANLGLWHWDASRREFWTANIFGPFIKLDEGESPGYESFLARVHADDEPTVRYTFQEAMKGGELQQTEFRLIDPTGSPQWVIAAGRLASAPPGGTARLTGIVRNITRRRLAEIEVAEQRAQLSHLTRVAVLGELSGALAHELGQPLTAILSNAQAAQRFLAKETPDIAEVRSIVADIIFDDMRAGDMIQQLRSMFNKHEIEFELVDMNQTIGGVEKILHSELIARNVRLIMRLSAHLLPIRGHRVQLQQVLLNLIVNACDALQSREAGDRTVTITTELTQNGEIQTSVKDDGAGIAPEILANLFKPFVSSKASGLGLGLSVCQSIIRAHGGRLWASNNEDRGATFLITLPAISSSSAVPLASAVGQ